MLTASLDDLVVTYVDDGSTDATASVASELIATLPHGKVLVQDANRGKGAAIRAGVAAAWHGAAGRLGYEVGCLSSDVADLIAEVASRRSVDHGG